MMKKFLKCLTSIFFFTSLFSCNTLKNREIISISNVEELNQYSNDYFLIIYADWCSFCKATIPYAYEYFGENTSIPVQFLDIDSLNELNKSELFLLLKSKMKKSDPSISKNRLLIPNISIFKKNELLFSKSGLGTTKESVVNNITNLKAILEASYIS